MPINLPDPNKPVKAPGALKRLFTNKNKEKFDSGEKKEFLDTKKKTYSVNVGTKEIPLDNETKEVKTLKTPAQEAREEVKEYKMNEGTENEYTAKQHIHTPAKPATYETRTQTLQSSMEVPDVKTVGYGKLIKPKSVQNVGGLFKGYDQKKRNILNKKTN